MPCALHGLSRRNLLCRAGAAGLMTAASGAGLPAMASLFEPGDFINKMTGAFGAAGGAELGQIIPFELTGASLPWAQKLAQVSAGQQVTFILTGRWYMARALDLWFEPGFVFFARVSGGAMFNPMDNVGTWTVETDGELEIARSAGEFASAQGDLALPLEAYTAAEGKIEGVAIVWNADAKTGLRLILAQGDPGGNVRHALERAVSPPKTPQGWHNHFNFGEAGVVRECDDEMCCETHKNVSILQRDVDLELSEDLTLDWSWLIEELPSRVGENTVPTHDYLSIAVEFDDGQDITYFWSAELPEGEVFRCPLPGWNAVETHVVERSGQEGLGQWQVEQRKISQDYHAHIGGPAQRVSRIWLLGVSVFQRQSGKCRYRNVTVGDPATGVHIGLI